MCGLSLEIFSLLLKTFAPVNSEKRLIKFLFLPISQDHKNKFLIFQDLRTSAFAINVFSSINSPAKQIPSSDPWASMCKSLTYANPPFLYN